MEAIQEQIRTLMVGEGTAERTEVRQNTESKMEVAKLPTFSRKAEKVARFISACKLYLKNIREAIVEEQVITILSYIQGRSVDVWKENILEDLEVGELEYESVERFLENLKKKFET